MDYIEIFFDTCILRANHCYSEFKFGTLYSDFVDFLGTNDLIDKCKLNFCRIVLDELSKQVTEEYNKDLQIIKRFKSINEKTIEIENNFINNINLKIEEYIKGEKGNIIEIPITTESYKKIIDRAINKKKPFCGDKGNSDKGFKDAIQWESIIKHAEKSKSKEYVLITENKNDFTDVLEKEFNDITKKKIKIFYKIGEAQKYILELNDEKSNYDLVKELLDEMFNNNKIKDFIAEVEQGRDYEIPTIESIGNLIDLGNNYYSFDIYQDEEHNCFYRVDCKLEDSELYAKDIIICL